MTNFDEKESKLEKFKQRPFWQRTLLFIFVVALWFTLVNFFSEEEADPVLNARNKRDQWLLSTFVVAIICPFFFYRKKQKKDSDSN